MPKKGWKALTSLYFKEYNSVICVYIVDPHSVYHGVLSKRPRLIEVKYQGATRSCPGKLRNFPANTPSWAIAVIIVKFHGQLFLLAHGTLLVAHGTLSGEI
jgi:hypothetical protein